MSTAGAAWDVIVVGGGIAGLSLAAELSADRRVVVLEKESTLAAHTTGRSVATFIQSYGNTPIHALNAASLPFFHSAASADGIPFAKPLPFLYAASESNVGILDIIYDAARAHSREMRFLDGASAAEYCPILRPEWVVRGLVDPSVLDIDVHALMQHHASVLRKKRRSDRDWNRASVGDTQGPGVDYHRRAREHLHCIGSGQCGKRVG